MLKSIGRSSHFWAKNWWRHCLPAAPSPQDYLLRLFSAAVAAGAASAGVVMRHAH
jgi:hypothetical protein